MPAPIALFVYNRPDHVLKTLEALALNDLAGASKLYIFADGAKDGATDEEKRKIEEVDRIIRSREWCSSTTIVTRQKNIGLAENIVDGITDVVNRHGKVIVLEDDIVTSKGFLQFMNDALDLYENHSEVMHVSGYMFPVKTSLPDTFFYNQTSCWGWGTWKHSWQSFNVSAGDLVAEIQKKGTITHFNLDGAYPFFEHLKANAEGRMKTWAVKWQASVYLKNGLCLHPGHSLVNNIGMDNSGANSGVEPEFDTKLASFVPVRQIPLREDLKARKSVADFYRSIKREKKKTSLLRRVLKKIKSVLK